MWNTACAIFLMVSIVGNVFLVYKMFDASVTLTYLEDSCASRGESLFVMKELLPRMSEGYPKDKFLEDARFVSKQKDVPLTLKGDVVAVGDVGFIFSDGRLVGIEYY